MLYVNFAFCCWDSREPVQKVVAETQPEHAGLHPPKPAQLVGVRVRVGWEGTGSPLNLASLGNTRGD